MSLARITNARGEGIPDVTFITGLFGSTSMNYAFTGNYDAVVVFGVHLDSDNNADNYIKVFDTAAGAGKDVITGGMWTPFKPTASTGTFPIAATSFSNDIDKNTLIRITNSYSCFSRAQYKTNVKAGDTIYCYSSHGGAWGPVFFVIGFNWRAI